MTEPDYMQGFRQDLPMPIGWRKGQRTIDLPVLCCEECASTQVAKRDNGKGEAYVWWECGSCRHRFRLPAGIGLKVYLHG